MDEDSILVARVANNSRMQELPANILIKDTVSAGNNYYNQEYFPQFIRLKYVTGT